MDLKIEPYSERSFKLTGETTRNYVPVLKEHFGAYTPGVGWCFSHKQRAKVEELVKRIQAGEVETTPPKTTRRKSPRPEDRVTSKYQTVNYTMIRPRVGMRATYNGVSGIITDVFTNRNTVESFLFETEGVSRKAYIINGCWSLLSDPETPISLED